MTVAARPNTDLSLDEAIQQGVNAAVDGYGVAETAAKIWDSGLDPEAAEACGVVGLRTLIHQHLAATRRPVPEDGDGAAERADAGDERGGRPVANIHYAKAHWHSVLAANYEAADGTRKPVMDFTPADVTYLRTLANARADGYLRVRDAMDMAASALKRQRKAIVSHLTEKAQRQIAEALS